MTKDSRVRADTARRTAQGRETWGDHTEDLKTADLTWEPARRTDQHTEVKAGPHWSAANVWADVSTARGTDQHTGVQAGPH